MPLCIDRMAVEDGGGTDPVRLARAIHAQLPGLRGATPVREIALALDIHEIREEHLTNIEGALVTTAERDVGSILVSRTSNPQRRRYTVAHELLHFLNPLHQQTTDGGFECSRSDMILSGTSTRKPTRHQQQEIEANTFAIELLAPSSLMRPFLLSFADLEKVLQAADALELSKEATARRYVQLHRDRLAIVFSKDGAISYFDRGEGFPWLAVDRGDALPGLPKRSSLSESLLPMNEADADDWLSYSSRTQLYAQTLLQSGGHAMTLLLAERDGGEDD
ncbi:ImmA/IrrE family metallo-endopeptidase [Aurantimonas sp. C2-6-R+9]|uniref:ImmA/IrrE family metallo-endopeptidase n=1 Tax=unclassified Aurantimonas TaxID=2638230 RepID=UPI002E17FBBC|nr:MULTISPECIES: ImmA/IrrE family metallo-endopeptidase [unclassified Aurantimonas]MEC5293044.1 ImmA/IrrE family metallo-endopeptidase [Aurantimonas sp. C2-3-R2]MEC5383162.1 ImmA/IrrE family metallo-endopeptidase [Aurantimonas sp. C2-6-R+9]MEC5414047.1 ImmA/IrrE family metallo-endopeptidase [Aurantimonas sp. C2-4-R8]